MKNALLINIPLTETRYPSASLASIVPVFKKHDYNIIIKDLNLELANEFEPDMVDKVYDLCQIISNLEPNELLLLQTWIEEKIDSLYIVPDVIAVSLLSHQSVTFAKVFLPILKSKFPNTTIIVGGSGVSSSLGKLTDFKTYGQYLLDNNHCTNVIFGEGEVSLDNLLQNKDYPGINKNNPVQISNLDTLDPPDYSNFDMNNYNGNILNITGSRGCVRQCNFCDIGLTWPKFRYRSPESQVREIIEHSKKYNVTHFEFTDSLINGSVSGWIKFNELLANAKQKDPDLKDITYAGQAICRSQKSQPEIMYELMHYAGVKQISVGIESFSERIRNDMKKKFSNEAIDYHLEQCGRWSIPNIFLMIVGYPLETIEDHETNMSHLDKYKIYSDMGTIFMIRWGLTMHIYADTPLFKDANKYGIDVTKTADLEALYTWTSSLNPELDFVERVRRRVELYEKSNELGYSQPNSRGELGSLLSLLETHQISKKLLT